MILLGSRVEKVSGMVRFHSLETSHVLGLPALLLIKSSLGGSRLWALSNETTPWREESVFASG